MSKPTRKPFVKRSKARDEKFLALLEEGIGPVKAAKEADYSIPAVYQRRKDDETFAQLWEDAYEVGVQVAITAMEEEADRRAIEGVSEPIYYKDQLLQHVQKYSDTLLMFRMKRLDSAYRERMDLNHSGKVDAGVLVVPAIASVDDWGKAAEDQQRDLKGNVRN